VSVTVRRAAEHDLPALLRLLAQLHPADPELAATVATSAWQTMLVQPGRQILLAELDDATVGSIDCMTMANLTRGARPYVLVENVVVDSAHRRRGIATQLLNEAVAIGRSIDACKIQLATGAGPTAEALYVSAGFTERAQGLRYRLFPTPMTAPSD
jgi:ribosomal protein S18 acetylase RimI-like enzyme